MSQRDAALPLGIRLPLDLVCLPVLFLVNTTRLEAGVSLRNDLTRQETIVVLLASTKLVATYVLHDNKDTNLGTKSNGQSSTMHMHNI